LNGYGTCDIIKKVAVKKRILIVDDEPGIGKVLRIEFSLSGFDVSTTASGAEAIKLIRAREPDVVLLDILMPGVTGIDVLNEVRTFSRVPVIAFTGHAEMGRAALEIGANDYITKPFDHELLLEKVNSVLGEGKPVKKPRRGKETNPPR
jgi:DNA-binding response OmpR family regulator